MISLDILYYQDVQIFEQYRRVCALLADWLIPGIHSDNASLKYLAFQLIVGPALFAVSRRKSEKCLDSHVYMNKTCGVCSPVLLTCYYPLIRKSEIRDTVASERSCTRERYQSGEAFAPGRHQHDYHSAYLPQARRSKYYPFHP